MPPISDLVQDTKLETQFYRDHTEHVYYVTGATPRQRKVRKAERWERDEHIGTGAFGTVWLEKSVTENGAVQHRAVKEIRKSAEKSRAVDYSRELEAIAKFSHPKYERCFVRSSGWYENDTSIFIAMEYFSYGDLQNYLLSPILEGEVQQITSQVLEGLSFMHDNGFVHRDLKPTNILVKSAGPDWWVKIGDFGISKRAEEGLTALRTLIGTPGFLAPEVLVQLYFPDDSDLEISEEYTAAVDMWSLGEIAFRALTGEQPFPIRSMRTYIKGLSSFPLDVLRAHGVSNEGCDLVKSLMAPIPKDRLTAKEALRHIWIEPQEAYSQARSSIEMKRFSPPAKEAIPSSEYPTTQASARWSTLDNQQLGADTSGTGYPSAVSFPSQDSSEILKDNPSEPEKKGLFGKWKAKMSQSKEEKKEREMKSMTFLTSNEDSRIGGATTSSDTAISDITISDTAISDIAISDTAISDIMPQPMQNTTRSPFITERPAENLQLEREIMNPGAQLTEDGDNTISNRPLLLPSARPGHLQTTASSDPAFSQTPKTETVTKVSAKRKPINAAAGSGGQTTLYQAALQGHDSLVQLLLEQGADIHAKNVTDGYMALHIAALRGHEKVIQILLATEADVNAKTTEGWTALHMAAEKGHAGIARLLLSKGSHVNATISTRQTPLHSAAFNGHDSLIQVLLEHKADVHARLVSGHTALHIAAERGHEKAIQVLLAMGANINVKSTKGWTALHLAAQNGHAGTARLLLSKGSHVNAITSTRQTPLHSAALNGHDSLIQVLLEHKADIHARFLGGHTALHIAAQRGHEKAVQVLLAMGADINAKPANGWTALHLAAQDGHAGTARLLLSKGPNVNATTIITEQTPLHQAALNGHDSLVQLLLEHKADIHARFVDGYMALHIAAKRGHEKAVQVLLAMGADINAKTTKGWTALHLAAQNGHAGTARLLLSKGPNVNATTSITGQTPLYQAALNGHDSLIQLLLEHKADVYAKIDTDGFMALHIAAQRGHEKAVQVLLAMGVDVDAKTTKGRTALHLAAQNGNETVVRILLEKGANISARNQLGLQPHHVAKLHGQKSVVQILNERRRAK